MKCMRTLQAGEPGTLQLIKKYGDRLVRVRYYYDLQKKKKYKTVELIEQEDIYYPNAARIPSNKKVYVYIGYDEEELRRRIKGAGGKWDYRRQLWKLCYKKVQILGLEERIRD